MPAGWDALAVNRINGVMQTLRDVRELPSQLVWSKRIPKVPMTDGEIMARLDGNVIVADIIMDDQKAVVRNPGQFTTERVKIPNYKHGSLITQEMINLLQRINAGGGIPMDNGIFADYRNRTLDSLLVGIEQREEAVNVAMLLDTYSYDRLGVKLAGVSWGTPADLKVTVSPLWTSPTTATPIDAILTLTALAAEKYGEMYNRITMTSADFRLMIATTEFAAKAQLYSQLTFPAGTFPSKNIPVMRDLAGRILGMDIELYDAKYWSESTTGALTASGYLPAGKVVLSDSNDDGDANVRVFGQGIVTETVVGSTVGGLTGMIGTFTGPSYGPVGFATAADPAMNPPGMLLWAVDRGWPIKKRLSSNAVLTVQ